MGQGRQARCATASGRRQGIIAMVLAALLSSVAVLPATADHDPPPESHDTAGSGEFEGTELVEDQQGFPCFRVTRHLFGLRGVGTYEGRTAGGDPVVFRGAVNEDGTQPVWRDGPLRLEVENTEPYYHSPFGTHGTETGGGAGCNAATTGAPVPAEFRVFAAEGGTDTDGDLDVDVLTGAAWIYRLDGTGQKIPCRAQGTYARGTPGNPGFGDPAWKAEWTLGEDCVVVGNAAGTPGTGTAPRGTLHTQHGYHGPCFNGVGGCVNNFRVSFAQFFPKPGPFLALSGPATAATNCERPVTVTARLTVSGFPEPNVPVTFSVAGPAPSAPPTGAAPTGSDGRASFSFGAAQPGDYTITAEAVYQGQTRRATHTVRFSERPPLAITVTGPPNGHTDEPVTTTATVVSPCGAMPGAVVRFSVTAVDPPPAPWRVPGAATPSTGEVVTDASGQASFSFAGTRAGAYAVTATASLPTGFQTSATHTVATDIRVLRREGALDLPEQNDTNGVLAAVRDPAGRFAYFGKKNGLLVKVDLATFQRVGELRLTATNGQPVWDLKSAVIDPEGRFAYFGAAGDSFGGEVVKVDLNSTAGPGGFAQVGVVALGLGEDELQTAVIPPAGDFAYFGAWDRSDKVDGRGRVVKVDLATFQRVGAITLEGLGYPTAAVLDPAARYAYVVTSDLVEYGRMVKIDLESFELAGALELHYEDEYLALSAVVDPAGRFAYVGTADSFNGAPGRIVRIDLQTFRRVDAIDLRAGESNASANHRFPALIDPAGDFAYFGSEGKTVVAIDLRRFQRYQAIAVSPDPAETALNAAVIDPTGEFAYFGTDHGLRPSGGTATNPDPLNEVPPQRVVKVRLVRPPHPALSADDDTYATEHATPLTVPAPGVLDGDVDTADGDPVVALDASDPAGGSVTLGSDGSFTYTPDANFFGTDSFTYRISDGVDYSAPATVSITVAPPPGLTGSASGYFSNVSLFGGPPGARGPAPTVTLAPDGANSPQDASVDQASAVYGPATLFKSGAIQVHTEGSRSPDRVMSSASVAGHPEVAERPGPLLYDGLASSCRATGAGTNAAVSATNVVVETKYDPDTQEPVAFHPVPANPPPGYTVTGTIDHVGDSFRIVFNDQVRAPDGRLLAVNAARMELLGPIAVGELVIARSVCGAPPGPAPIARVVADFDGDGDTDPSVFRAGAWFADGQPTAFLGIADDVPVPGDYDGDGDVDRAVYRHGAWYTDGAATAFLGVEGDVPVPADYDGDGDTDRAVYRPSVGAWYVEGQDPIYNGLADDIPVPGDYDGDGDAEPAVYRPSVGGWYVAGQDPVFWGLPGDVPVPADYDGDGDTDRGIWRPSVGGWYVEGQAPAFLGLDGDVPVPGDYDGDGTTDAAIWRPQVGGWYVDGQATVFLGLPGDVPLPLPQAVYRAYF